MKKVEESQVFREDVPPGPVQAEHRRVWQELRDRIACVLRLCRRKDGRLLHDLAVLRRVSGATLAQVREVRAELEEAGELVETLEEDRMRREGKTL